MTIHFQLRCVIWYLISAIQNKFCI